MVAEASASSMVDLYLPLCRPARGGARVLGHLGQSIDGFIATSSGDSSFVNDQENIRHLHRLRALHDAVIVGAGTIASDDPRLTTRRVPGPNPARVVLDPRRRLPRSARVFTDDDARTILVISDAVEGTISHGAAEVLPIPETDGVFDLPELVRRLSGLGLTRLFVEGGGATVTRFFEADLLDRLHIAIAPVFIGRGRPGIQLKETDRMENCPRPRHRIFAMGEDVLFDCELREDETSIAIFPDDRPQTAEAEAEAEAELMLQPRTENQEAIRRIR